VGAVFFLNGALFGSLVARMPAVRDHAGVTNGELGLALACVAIGALVAMPIAGILAARRGSRQTTRASLALTCVAVLLPTLAPSLPVLAAAFLVHGAAMGALDVTMNAHGVAVEHRYGRPILSGFHAAFSLGGLVGAAIAALAAAADVDVWVQVLAVSVVSAAVGLGWSRRFLPSREDAVGHADPVLVRPPRRLWALGALAFSCLLIEGAAADWSAVYLHDELHAGAGGAALAFVAFSVTMVLGRLTGDALVQRLGAETLVRAGGLIASVGFGAALLIDAVPAAFVGFAALGVGMATIVPVVFRAAGGTPGIAPGVALAAVSSMGYLGFVAGPPTIGLLTQLTSLPQALAIIVVLGGAVAVLATATRVPGADAAGAPECAGAVAAR
jgi:MFS family permease